MLFGIGRGRALEIILGANDFDGDTAQRYGYVNRALPDAELDGFVDALAGRIASFDRRPIAAAKYLLFIPHAFRGSYWFNEAKARHCYVGCVPLRKRCRARLARSATERGTGGTPLRRLAEALVAARVLLCISALSRLKVTRRGEPV